MIRTNFVFCCIIFIALPSLARESGTTVGGGGHGVECGSDSVQLLDLFESKGSRAHEVANLRFVNREFALLNINDLIVERLNEAQVPLSIVDGSLKNLATLRHDFIFSSRESFDTYFTDSEVNTTFDEGTLQVPLPAGCRVVQLAAYRNAFVVSKIIFNRVKVEKLSPESLAALLVHEAFHDYFDSHSATNTIAIRQFVTYLFSDDRYRLLNRSAFRALVHYKMAVNSFSRN